MWLIGTPPFFSAHALLAASASGTSVLKRGSGNLSPINAASTSPSISICGSCLVSGARVTNDGSLYCATCGSSMVMICTFDQSTP